jgi:competence protein ComEA
MNWKEFASDYLTFTRRDRIAIIAIALLIVIVFFLPDTLSNSSSSKPATPDTAWMAAMKRIELKETDNKQQFSQFNEDNSSAYQYDRPNKNHYSKPIGELFYFDPNTLPNEGWQKLGLRDKTISTIQNYVSKGGKFRKPEDLQKIYGLFPNEFERIAPYIKIESAGEKNGNKYYAEKTPDENQPPKTYAPRYAIVDINSADTTALIALPGIGSKLATRIIAFRDKLGGFYSVTQVGETFGLPDSVFQKIKQYLKLELKVHPYIRYSLANPIVAYRNEHGPFAKVEDIKKVMVVTDEIFLKVSPYLSAQ